MKSYDKDIDMARRIAAAAEKLGGRVYFVGGYVRDRLQGRDNKDIDIEVHGIKPAALEEILDSLGSRISMGESFGIYALKGYGLDIAMPRKEKLIGRGHRDFDVTVDPFIGTYKAAQRRDFTVNALMQDVLTEEVTDHFGGIDDMKKGILRHVSDETFCEDPLRVLRGAQFAARFGYRLAPETVKLCSSIRLDSLSRERVMAEMMKALMKSDKPSIFFETLRLCGRLEEWFSQPAALIGVPQSRVYHLEGDAWIHTMMVLDCAAAYRDQLDHGPSFMLAALCHDFGKAICTQEINGAIHAYRHEQEGLPLAEAFLKKLTDEKQLIRNVLNLVELHMKPNVLAKNRASVKSTNKLFDSTPLPLELIYLAASDNGGKISAEAVPDHTPFLLERLETYREMMAQPHVTGKDLLENGVEPGRIFSEALAYAHKLRLAGIGKPSALKQTLAYVRKKSGTN